VANGPRLVILGKQGAGKGTQCARLAAHYVVPHISTGDIFRAAQRSGTELGKRLKATLEAGNLVEDEITIAVVAERLEQDDTRRHGFILDGFPRNIHQAEELSKLLVPDDIDLAIDLEIPTELAVTRLASRRVCRDCQTIYGPAQPPRFAGVCDVCGGEVVQRDDDTEEAIRRRLSIYEKDTEPIITWYLERDMLVTIDGSGDPDDVTQRLIRAIDRRRARHVDEV
jgi:adenylate kinase